MASKPSTQKLPQKSIPQSIWERGLSTRAILGLFAFGTLLFYSTPLFDSAASIQWDAVDVHYSSQKYFADSIGAGHLPYWTPYVYSGMPFLADPQTGAWYPLNWPFFLAGVTPKAIEWETALHCLLAAAGAFLLARDLLGGRWAAVLTGVFYALSGFFAAHSSHTGIFQTAALFPWLLWTALRAAQSARWLPAAAVAGGLIVLAGHFQTALYAICATVVLIAVNAGMRRAQLGLPALAVAATLGGALLLPAVMTLPGSELTAESVRSAADYSRNAEAALTPGGLLTLVSPDHFGALEVQQYTGPADVTQHYFYQGILLIPLALVGLVLSTRRWHAVALIVPAMWYAFGPAGGLYSILAKLPGLRLVRAPVHDWFIVALGLALLAAAGASALGTRFNARWIPLCILAVTALDLWYWNMDHNQLAYARQSYSDLYGYPEERFARVAASVTSPTAPYRLWAPFDSPGFGPLNGALDTRTEVTYGYNPLELKRYAKYMDASSANPRLLDALAVTAKLDASTGFFVPNPTALPRVFAPPIVSAAAGADDAARRLAALDPAREAVVEGAAPNPQNGPAQLQIAEYRTDFYRVRCQATQAALVTLAVPYFPGWRAEVDGHPAKVVPVDLALMGVSVPEGAHEIVFAYHPDGFAAGAAISALAALAAGVWLYLSFGRT